MDGIYGVFHLLNEIDSYRLSGKHFLQDLIVHNQTTADFSLKDISDEALAAVKTLLDEYDFNLTITETSPNCYDCHIQRRTTTDNLWIRVEATSTHPAFWRCPQCRQGNSNKWWNTNTFCPYCGHRNIVT